MKKLSGYFGKLHNRVRDRIAVGSNAYRSLSWTHGRARFNLIDMSEELARRRNRIEKLKYENRCLEESYSELEKKFELQVNASRHLCRRVEDVKNSVLELYANVIENSEGGWVLLEGDKMLAVSPVVRKSMGYKDKTSDFRMLPIETRRALGDLNKEVLVRIAEGEVSVGNVKTYAISPNVVLANFDVKELKKLRNKSETDGKDLLTLLRVHYLNWKVEKKLEEG
jgi:small nuclear ribonucleoprotein (snRNP)-like protein